MRRGGIEAAQEKEIGKETETEGGIGIVVIEEMIEIRWIESEAQAEKDPDHDEVCE